MVNKMDLGTVLASAAVAAVVAGVVMSLAAAHPTSAPPRAPEKEVIIVAQPTRNHYPPPVVRVAADPNLIATTPETYTQVGYLTREGGQPLPLYGQASRVRRYRHYYYTILPGTGIKVSVWSRRRDCMDDIGCDELSDGDEVVVPETTESVWTVKLHGRALRL